jgi:hypothetical protein
VEVALAYALNDLDRGQQSEIITALDH